MTSQLGPYSVLLPEDATWRESNMMKIPNTNLAEQLGSRKLGARLWRLPPSPRTPAPPHRAGRDLLRS